MIASAGVEVWPLEEADVALARQLYEQYPALQARDLCHLSSCRRRGVREIKTFDQTFAGISALIVNEAYTSKTVSWTGEIIHNLGGRKTVKSSEGQRMDRDINGARGTFLRALGDTPFLRQHISGSITINLNVC